MPRSRCSPKRDRCQTRRVSDTARELGYASDEGFSRAFRRHVGVTPSAWRSQRTHVPA
ncbi:MULTISPECIES: AraC family transcriptional regulator [Microbacterium]|uniref:Helix-turn-helix domain-containing protein n=1 Tax=Microbacterium profundi TaxID=450380 RepID=A0ABV3LFK8_9MICO|nr:MULTISPECIES: AraC family transcriptional regulator [Microbacterium]MCE7483253.1 AraC family transcriptional regulator [Microbacterium profundi]